MLSGTLLKIHKLNHRPQRKSGYVCLPALLLELHIHLELAEDMTTKEFILCLCRFIARRGRPKQILSDNAKHFKTTRKVLNDIWKNVITSDNVTDFSTNKGIEWKLIVDLAPWMGGLYERLVGLTIRALRKTNGNICLTEKQLVTVLAEVETVVNSRPLVYIDDDINSSVVITPLSFLSLSHQHFVPDCMNESNTDFQANRKIDTGQKILESWKSDQRYLNQFWKTYNKEYPLSLRERN